MIYCGLAGKEPPDPNFLLRDRWEAEPFLELPRAGKFLQDEEKGKGWSPPRTSGVPPCFHPAPEAPRRDDPMDCVPMDDEDSGGFGGC